MARRVEIVLGPPGTGKTTYLMEELQRYLDNGGSPERVGFVSFSRRALETVIVDKLGREPGDFPHFRTIHSTAFHFLGLKREDVMQTKHYAQFAALVGVPLSAGGHEDPLWDGTVGDRALALHNLARARGTTLEREWRQAMMRDLPLHTAVEIVHEYERFKYVNALWDFHDMITRAQGRLPVDLLFVDEAQDTSAAQWQFLRQAARDVPRVVIAGDDDQAVYGWSGADGDALRRFAGERKVLPRSWRLPRVIKSLADEIAGRITVRVPKSFASRDEEGSVEWLRDARSLDLRQGGSWLLLARSNYQLDQFRDLARSQGVVYTLPNGEWSWTLPAVRAAKVYEHLRKGEEVIRSEVKVLGPYLPEPLPKVLPPVVTWGDLWGETALEVSWMDALPGISPSDREYIRALRQGGESLVKPGRVRIGTVHSVKGAEADNVVLVTDVSTRVAHGRRLDPDAEHRVQYVGVTRARHNLTLLLPSTATHWAF